MGWGADIHFAFLPIDLEGKKARDHIFQPPL